MRSVLVFPSGRFWDGESGGMCVRCGARRFVRQGGFGVDVFRLVPESLMLFCPGCPVLWGGMI